MNRGAQQGFTLLELLVALVVFGLLLTTAYAGLRTAVTGWERAEIRIEAREEQRAVTRFLRRTLAEITPLARIGQGTWAVWFEGTPERLVFTSTMPALVAAGGVQEMALAVGVDEASGQRGLLLTWQPLDPEAEPGAFDSTDRTTRLLAENVDKLSFEFFGSAESENEPRWHFRWEARRRLPEMIRVVVEGQQRRWPAMVARIHSDSIRFLRGNGRFSPGRTLDEESETGEPADGQREGSVESPLSGSAAEAGS